MELFKKIPQVAKILEDKDVLANSSLFYLSEIKEEIESELNQIRFEIKQNIITELNYSIVIERILLSLDKRDKYSLRRVINATGTVLHTNLGRAVYSEKMIENVKDVLTGYSNLEYDLTMGQRGSRYAHVDAKIAKLIGAEACLVVNNNASAVLLTMNEFGKGKEVIISRGELVEIGGSFRIPEIIESSGAVMREVGTTNRTHLKDYSKAVNDKTGLILKVHPSNFEIKGFVKEVSSKELSELNILLIEDLGSGAVIDYSKFGLNEKTIQDSIASGVDIVTFSGDKLLGGPQVGIIAGSKKLIDELKSNPMTRALRVGKMTIAALEAVVREYRGDVLNPTVSMISVSITDLVIKAEKLKSVINKYEIEIVDVCSTVGGGSLPTSSLMSVGITIESDKLSANSIERTLRQFETPIISRIIKDKVTLDMRTIFDRDIEVIAKCLNA